MRAGQIEQIARPRDVYERPSSRFVADFIGTSNFLDGVIESSSATDEFVVRTGAGELRVGSPAALSRGDRVIVAVRPENLALTKVEPADESTGPWNGVIETRAFLGESIDYIVKIGDLTVRSRVNPSVLISTGDHVKVKVVEGTASLLSGD
jgi:iron(III) transport system ATP-binding protein